MAYDAIESLEPAGVIMRGFISKKENSSSSKGNWRQFELNMLQHAEIVKGSKK